MHVTLLTIWRCTISFIISCINPIAFRKWILSCILICRLIWFSIQLWKISRSIYGSKSIRKLVYLSFLQLTSLITSFVKSWFQCLLIINYVFVDLLFPAKEVISRLHQVEWAISSMEVSSSHPLKSRLFALLPTSTTIWIPLDDLELFLMWWWWLDPRSLVICLDDA